MTGKPYVFFDVLCARTHNIWDNSMLRSCLGLHLENVEVWETIVSSQRIND